MIQPGGKLNGIYGLQTPRMYSFPQMNSTSITVTSMSMTGPRTFITPYGPMVPQSGARWVELGL